MSLLRAARAARSIQAWRARRPRGGLSPLCARGRHVPAARLHVQQPGGARSASAATRSRSISTTRCRRPSCAPSRSRRASATTACTPYKNYLFAIARNLVLDEFRNREVAMSPFIDQLDGAAPRPSDGARRRRGGAGARRCRDGAVGAACRPSRSSCATSSADSMQHSWQDWTSAIVPSSAHRFEEQQTQVEAGAASGLSHMQARTLEKKLRARFLEFMQTNGYLEAYAGDTARRAMKER